MQFFKQLILSALFLGIWAATEANIVVDNPMYEGTNSETIVITKVELTDTATVIDINASFKPHYWIRIGSDSYLESKDARYPITHAEGIVLDDLFWMPDSGEADFKLFFKPLPQDTESFAFIEGEVERAFRIWGISMVGNTDIDYPAGLPESMKKEPMDGPLPAHMMSCGTTKVNVHLLGDRNALVDSDYLLVYNTIYAEQEQTPLNFDPSTGMAHAEFDQIGTVNAFIIYNNKVLGELWIAPGENIDIYIDGRVIGYSASLSRIKYSAEDVFIEKNLNPRPANPHGYLYTTGHYADLNRFTNQYRFADMPDLWDETKFSYRMTGDEYIDEIERQYFKSVDLINGLDRPQMLKEARIADLQQHAAGMLVTSSQLLHIWDEETHSYEHIPFDSLNIIIEPRHIQQISSLFDIESPSMLLGGDLIPYLHSLIAFREYKEAWGRQSKLLNALRPMVELADNGSLEIDEETRTLIGDDIADMLMRRNQRAIDMKAEMASMIMPAPDVPLDDLFKTIILPHKGKVLLIDIWNTWCGPCRAAIEQNEPLKTGELASDDLVWIYIANETSPIAKYIEMVPNIKGIHYRLTPEQWRQIVDVDFPEIDGIPAYILVDRDGTPTLRLDFRDHDLMKDTLKSMLK